MSQEQMESVAEAPQGQAMSVAAGEMDEASAQRLKYYQSIIHEEGEKPDKPVNETSGGESGKPSGKTADKAPGKAPDEAADEEAAKAADKAPAEPEDKKADKPAGKGEEQSDPMHTPAKEAKDINLKLPEGFAPDNNITSDFQNLCVESGLTPAQAQTLVDWQIKVSKEAHERLIAEGTKALRADWGTNFETNRQKALTFFTNLDRKMGGKLASSSAGRGIADNPDFILALHAMSEMVSEDSLSGFESGGGAGKAVDRLEFYKKLFKEGN